MTEEEELLVAREGRLGRIRLNRPSALNSLTLNMVRRFTLALSAFAADAEIVAVLVTGEGGRGLCAGGDIRTLYDMRTGDKEYYRAFWREEYSLNARISSYLKPYIVLMDGVVMGGGVGISAHGSRRVATERTQLAMPETRIGFIPDVGGTWLLTRRSAGGVYMALTGAAVGAADAIHLGLADMMIDSSSAAALVEKLAAASSVAEVESALSALAVEPEQGPLQQHENEIASAFEAETVEGIVEELLRCGSSFGQSAADEILRNSPTSLKVTHALLKRARRARRLEECLVDEYRAACSLLEGHDLYEGIRAAVVDKDKAPKWSPASLGDVDEAAVQRILAGAGAAEPEFELNRF